MHHGQTDAFLFGVIAAWRGNIMIPIVARTAEEHCVWCRIPCVNGISFRFTRWRAVLGVIIPGAMTGILPASSCMARIAGETGR